MDTEESKLREEVRKEIFEGESPSIVEPIPEEQVKDVEKADPYAGVPPAVRETLESITNQLGGLRNIDNRLKQTESRIGAITNQVAKEKKEAEEAERNKPSKEDIAAALKSEEAWDEMKEDFPEIAEAVSSKINKNTDSLKGLKKDIDLLRSTQKPVNNQVNKDLDVRLLTLFHPDWKKTVQTNEYKTWLSTQPIHVRRQAASGKTAEDGISVLNSFKKSKPSKNLSDIVSQRKSRLETNVTSPNKHKQTKIKAEADMSEAELRQTVWNELKAERERKSGSR